ncbi:MAG TPA: 4Fe-4S ferredoxin, partial [Sutterellaceae bacterium]|nr:4Fe-4S ferredoxin [Sutterellaceae bacterium]
MGSTTGGEELIMTSVNSKNIFDVVKKKYAPNQPEKNHKIDPV